MTLKWEKYKKVVDLTYKDILKQIEHKKNKKQKFKKHSMPKNRGFGRGKRKCRRCGRVGRGIIRKYNLYYCRQCFREIAKEMGFKKYS